MNLTTLIHSGRGKESALEVLSGKEPEGLLPLEQRLSLQEQMVESVKQLHSLGFVHCDLKPLNWIVTLEGELKLIDFGAVVKSGTSVEQWFETPNYISPEARYKPEKAFVYQSSYDY